MSMLRLPLHAERGPSVTRAGALSGAMTVNLLVLGALLLPAAIDRTLQGPELRTPELALIVHSVEAALLSATPTRSDPPPPAAPEVPVARIELPTPTIPTPVAIEVSAQVAAVPPAIDPVVPQPTQNASASAAANTLINVDSLAYIDAPQPDYPAVARRKGWEGTVVLRVRVDAAGLPQEVTIERSSGRPALDQAARRKVLSEWRFRPAQRDGLAVPAVALVPVAFRLPRG